MTHARDIVTQDAYSVAPHLLGLPLASPPRRLAAILTDVLLVALLTNAGGVTFGAAAAFVLWRLSARGAGGGVLRRSWRLALRGGAALVAFTAALSLWGSGQERAERVLARLGDDDEPAPAVMAAGVAGRPGVSAGVPRGDGKIEGLEGVAMAADLARLRLADTPGEARAAAEGFASAMLQQGAEPADVREAMGGVVEGSDKPWLGAVVDSVGRGLLGEEREAAASPDSLALAYAAALGAADSAGVAALQPRLAEAFAGERLAEQQRTIQGLEQRTERLDEELKEAREHHGVMWALQTAADDLGLGFGWFGLYFTAFLALWKGQTPGKRLFGLRVVRLDGRPISFWAAFERFGGYAAGFATGLLGFAQVFWDRNRQGVHDKICETVVVVG